MNDAFVCAVCLCLFDRPVVLPCDHNFCESCLRNVVISHEQQQRQSLQQRGLPYPPPPGVPRELPKCPLCREEFSPNNNGHNNNHNNNTAGDGLGLGEAVTATRGLRVNHALMQEMARAQSVPCGNEGCSVRVNPLQWKRHQDECVMAEVPCPHAQVGCTHKSMRRDLSAHVAECPYEKVKGLYPRVFGQLNQMNMRMQHLERNLMQHSQVLTQHEILMREERSTAPGNPLNHIKAIARLFTDFWGAFATRQRMRTFPYELTGYIVSVFVLIIIVSRAWESTPAFDTGVPYVAPHYWDPSAAAAAAAAQQHAESSYASEGTSDGGEPTGTNGSGAAEGLSSALWASTDTPFTPEELATVMLPIGVCNVPSLQSLNLCIDVHPRLAFLPLMVALCAMLADARNALEWTPLRIPLPQSLGTSRALRSVFLMLGLPQPTALGRYRSVVLHVVPVFFELAVFCAAYAVTAGAGSFLTIYAILLVMAAVGVIDLLPGVQTDKARIPVLVGLELGCMFGYTGLCAGALVHLMVEVLQRAFASCVSIDDLTSLPIQISDPVITHYAQLPAGRGKVLRAVGFFSLAVIVLIAGYDMEILWICLCGIGVRWVASAMVNLASVLLRQWATTIVQHPPPAQNQQPEAARIAQGRLRAFGFLAFLCVGALMLLPL